MNTITTNNIDRYAELVARQYLQHAQERDFAGGPENRPCSQMVIDRT